MLEPHSATTLVAAAVVGLGVGFLGGLFGKGGSAIATPLLHALGVPAVLALAAPLPATIPSTLAASRAYSNGGFISWPVVRWSVIVGIPATIVGASASRWVGGDRLVLATDVLLVILGARFALAGHKVPTTRGDGPSLAPGRIATVGLLVGLASGLLANSGGFLLGPLYLVVLRLPIKAAFASSLVVAAALAVPGTIVHAALGHIDWTLVAVLAATSVPLSFVGARVALDADPERLERLYGVALAVLGTVLLARG
jgi:uncharacterized membrane protein YfcA